MLYASTAPERSHPMHCASRTHIFHTPLAQNILAFCWTPNWPGDFMWIPRSRKRKDYLWRYTGQPFRVNMAHPPNSLGGSIPASSDRRCHMHAASGRIRPRTNTSRLNLSELTAWHYFPSHHNDGQYRPEDSPLPSTCHHCPSFWNRWP